MLLNKEQAPDVGTKGVGGPQVRQGPIGACSDSSLFPKAWRGSSAETLALLHKLDT